MMRFVVWYDERDRPLVEGGGITAEMERQWARQEGSGTYAKRIEAPGPREAAQRFARDLGLGTGETFDYIHLVDITEDSVNTCARYRVGVRFLAEVRSSGD